MTKLNSYNKRKKQTKKKEMDKTYLYYTSIIKHTFHNPPVAIGYNIIKIQAQVLYLKSFIQESQADHFQPL